MRFTEYLIMESSISAVAKEILKQAEAMVADRAADEGGKGYTDDAVMAEVKKIARKEHPDKATMYINSIESYIDRRVKKSKVNEQDESSGDKAKLAELEDRLKSAEASYARRERTVANDPEKRHIDDLKSKIRKLKDKLGTTEEKPSAAPSADFDHTIRKPTDVTLADIKKAFSDAPEFKIKETQNYFSIIGPKSSKQKFSDAMEKLKSRDKEARKERRNKLFKGGK